MNPLISSASIHCPDCKILLTLNVGGKNDCDYFVFFKPMIDIHQTFGRNMMKDDDRNDFSDFVALNNLKLNDTTSFSCNLRFFFPFAITAACCETFLGMQAFHPHTV